MRLKRRYVRLKKRHVRKCEVQKKTCEVEQKEKNEVEIKTEPLRLKKRHLRLKKRHEVEKKTREVEKKPGPLTVCTTYILPSGGLYATYHLLGEPETTIDIFHVAVLGIFIMVTNRIQQHHWQVQDFPKNYQPLGLAK